MASVESSAQLRGRIWRIEISALHASECVFAGSGLDRGEQDISLKKLRVFYVKGDLAQEDVQVICKRLLCDAVVEQYHIAECGIRATQDGPPQATAGSDPCAAQSSVLDSHAWPAVEILAKPGVTDPVAASTLRAIADLGLRIDDVKTGWRDAKHAEFEERFVVELEAQAGRASESLARLSKVLDKVHRDVR